MQENKDIELKQSTQIVMGIQQILRDDNFNLFFSLIVGVGLVCILRPKCKGPNCNVTKPPQEKDFDKHVYRMSGGKCYEFKTEVTECPASGAVEGFSRRDSPLSSL